MGPSDQADDAILLRAFAREGSERAFATLVARHVDWVYCAARRQVASAADAEEITQSVFVLLARKAATFGPTAVLTAWLFRATRLVAADARKRDARRRKHERAAAEHRAREADMRAVEPAEWEQIAPVLDEAIADLSTKDRQAVLLRFLQRKTHAEVARELGVSEAAAKVRVGRAVEKLRDLLARRGVVSAAAGVAGLLDAHAVQPAPAGLAASIASTAGTACTTGGGAAAGALRLPSLKTVLLTTTGAKLATVSAVATALLLAAAAAAAAATAVMVLLSTTGADPARPARAAAPPPPAAERSVERWEVEFNRTYGLDEGQILKRVPPPYIKQRRDWLLATAGPAALENLGPQPDRSSLVIAWNPIDRRATDLRGIRAGDSDLGALLHGVLGVSPFQFDAPPGLLERTTVGGDWVVRTEASADERAAALEQIIRAECELPLTLARRQAPREVIVVRGALHPRAAASPLHLFSDRKDEEKRADASGVLRGLLEHLGRATGRPIVNESAAPRNVRLKWVVHRSASARRMPPKRAAAKIDLLLKNLSAQSGLQMRREMRPVEVWEVSLDDSALPEER